VFGTTFACLVDMKTQGWKFFGITGLSLMLSVAASAAETRPAKQDIKTIWLARITGQTQCATKELPPSLRGAVEDLEKLDAVVIEAKLGALTDRAFCQECSCDRNLFHVARVSAEPEAVESALQSGWTTVDPNHVATPSLPELARDPQTSERYELLPVNVTE
jgi:hypothetical protein